ncbi:MAG TPA: peptide chain release factor N(5)-glutamine methyltransferase [Albitalea sp.]|jgi:release factor glutamine methyltransferase|nr:peptide chain release factor N(5)-glutamine methyltransferase [Albitalea sp.]
MPEHRAPAPTVAEAAAHARSRGVDRLDAQLLLARAMQRTRAWLLAHDDAPLTSAQWQAYRADTERRSGGEPLAYIVGEKEFHGLMLSVSRDVLVPRPDTETLVEWGLELLRGPLAGKPAPRVIDLGTGSGAIALAVKQARPAAQVTAVDDSLAALDVARRNAARLGLAVRWQHGDWWAAVTGQRFQLALSNPPYIADDDAHLVALRHEPLHALASGTDGLDAIRRIVGSAASCLAADGWLLLEHGHEQSAPVQALLRAGGFVDVQSRADIAGIARCSGGRMTRIPS